MATSEDGESVFSLQHLSGVKPRKRRGDVISHFESSVATCRWKESISFEIQNECIAYPSFPVPDLDDSLPSDSLAPTY